MGYACYDMDDGFGHRGYMVADKCHHSDCEAEIDRGISYLCYGCTKYFCEKHLRVLGADLDCFAGSSPQACEVCAVGVPEEDEE